MSWVWSTTKAQIRIGEKDRNYRYSTIGNKCTFFSKADIYVNNDRDMCNISVDYKLGQNVGRGLHK